MVHIRWQALIAVLGLSIVTGMIYAPHAPEKPGYVVEGVRQTETIDEGRLRQPVGPVRIAGFVLIVAGLVGVLLAQQLELASYVMTSSILAFALGAILAWTGRPARTA